MTHSSSSDRASNTLNQSSSASSNKTRNSIYQLSFPRHSLHQSSTTTHHHPCSTGLSTTSLTLHHHHHSSPPSILSDQPSSISFLSDLISNNNNIDSYSSSSSSSSSSNKLIRSTISSSPTTTNIMPTSPITHSISTSTHSNLHHSSTSNTTPTPNNTSLTSSTRAGPSRSNTLTVPLNHPSTSINNQRNHPRTLRSTDTPNHTSSLQSSSSSTSTISQQQPSSQPTSTPTQLPPSPSPSRVEPTHTGIPTTNPQTGQLEAKVVILGMQGVGKTSIVHRYTTGSFSYSLASTIGASFCTKKLSVDGCKVRLQIWDTAGQERFRSMAPMYYRGANAAILVYDITNQSSFDDIQNWLHELSANMSPELVIQIVGSKADLATDKRSVELEVAYQQILEWTESFPFTNNQSSLNSGSRTSDGVHSWPDLAITEVSAKDDFGIEDMFLVVTRRLVMRKAEIEETRLRKSRESILIEPNHKHSNQSNSNDSNSNSNTNGWCC